VCVACLHALAPGNFSGLDRNPPLDDVRTVARAEQKRGQVGDCEVAPDTKHGFNGDRRSSDHAETSGDV